MQFNTKLLSAPRTALGLAIAATMAAGSPVLAGDDKRPCAQMKSDTMAMSQQVAMTEETDTEEAYSTDMSEDMEMMDEDDMDDDMDMRDDEMDDDLTMDEMDMDDDMDMSDDMDDMSDMGTSNLAHTVTEQIEQDPLIADARIETSASGGVVTLSGEASTAIAKQRAADIAMMVYGVTSVDNNIKVDPKFLIEPARLSSAVENAIQRTPGLANFGITIDAGSHGEVILAGNVETLRQKNLARAAALSVRGVSGVDNRLEVEFSGNLSDEEISETIESAYAWDIRVNDNNIDVTVDDGEVTLSGQVSNPIEKEVAIGLAQIRGVTAVDATALDVNWSEGRVGMETDTRDNR